MNTVICTICEGHYHFGVAALSNSLYQHGFRGRIYAGYRGELPKWAKAGALKRVGKWEAATVLTVETGLELIFLPLTTSYHLSNFKPDFMLDLLDGPASEADAIFYFDPDICVVEKWSFFEDWVKCGLAVCENDWSPLPENHPRRIGWRKYFKKYNFDLLFKHDCYVNSGLVGVLSKDRSFIETWKSMQEIMAIEIGGLEKSAFKNSPLDEDKSRITYCFSSTDQDALNAAIEASDQVVSVLGKEAMGFKHGFQVAPHALGRPKPWEKKYFHNTLTGAGATIADIAFWNYVSGPIKIFNPYSVATKRLALKLCRALGRVYRRA